MQLPDDAISIALVACTYGVGNALALERGQRGHGDTGLLNRRREVDAEHAAIDALVDDDLLPIAADVELALGVPPRSPEQRASNDDQQGNDQGGSAPTSSCWFVECAMGGGTPVLERGRAPGRRVRFADANIVAVSHRAPDDRCSRCCAAGLDDVAHDAGDVVGPTAAQG